MKGTVCFSLLCVVLVSSNVLATHRHTSRPQRLTQGAFQVVGETVKAPKFDLCPTCVSFTSQSLDILINILLNGGVVGSCGTLCNDLAEKTGNKDLGMVCDLLCDYVGIKEFIKLIQKEDLDPIYFCELLKICKIFDNGDATFTDLEVHPATGQKGKTFAIAFSWMTRNGTGTGQLDIQIKTVDGLAMGSGNLLEAQAPGTYRGTASLSTDNSGCDPTQGPCEQWLPGVYTVILALCNGQCGSGHPHSQIYDTKQTTFNITMGAH